MGAGDRDDCSMPVPFDPGRAGYANEGEGLVDVEISTQGSSRKTDYCTSGGLVDCLLERLCMGCGDDEKIQEQFLEIHDRE